MRHLSPSMAWRGVLPHPGPRKNGRTLNKSIRSEEPRVTPKRRTIEANDSLYELVQEMQERDERLEREMMEREDRREREREERREREALLREERRDRDMAVRDSRFLAILERLINK
ncbi:hypothetical protein G5714_002597 [Onychostoma macrolepis]|uniref:Uncharacterized protein n=1 Tax=Onychostoma macrolepis TaxID=369639 RepID=A0A7J6D751_9TELE|nr:hypothetical protein G5714_002597 [Onychostoma macrolepis]